MPLKMIQGDILEGIDIEKGTEHILILHGCNCFHTMGSGIARYLRSKFPAIYEADVETTEYGDMTKLGTYSKVKVNEYVTILNCYTQFKYGKDRRHADYGAIDACLDKISHNFSSSVWNIRMPQIGCGLAGGDWSVVKSLIDVNLREFNVSIYYL
jgi:O-acetyl-ADP-ribose deacetylase (regulator of RNase III)